jgi:hypothetical protein
MKCEVQRCSWDALIEGIRFEVDCPSSICYQLIGAFGRPRSALDKVPPCTLTGCRTPSNDTYKSRGIPQSGR